MFSPLKDVVTVMDMDGFVINKKFYCKELGLLKVGDVAARSYFFDIGFEWSELWGKDRRTYDYVMRFIYKLPFGVPQGAGAYELLVLEEIVATFYYRAKRNERSIIAYKGGHFERDLLAKLNIPALNLECFGCPKARELIDQMIWLETCGNHTTCNAYLHCPKIDVEAFGQWLESLL